MSITIRKPKPGDHEKYILKKLHIEKDENGEYIHKEYIPTDVTWVYGSTEENRQKYINGLIENDISNDTEGDLRDKISHVWKITKAANIKGDFAEDETDILVVHDLKNANISEQDICRLIDGSGFDLGYYHWNRIYIFPKKVYISAEKLPEQIYARCQFKERVIRRVTRTIKLD